MADITAIVEGRPNYITTHQISEGTHPSLALLIRDIAKQLHALPSWISGRHWRAAGPGPDGL